MAGTGNRLAARFDGICENMEGAAAAHLCALYDTLFLEIRSVSNRVEDRNFAAWNLPLAMRRAQQAALIALDCLAEEKR
jgi:futalosine hydrolase